MCVCVCECVCACVSYVDGRAADVHGVVRVGGLDVEPEDVVDVGRVYVQRAEPLHHPGLATQHLKHTGGTRRHTTPHPE